MPNVSTPLRAAWGDITQAEFREQYRQLASLHDLAAFLDLRPSQLSYYAFRVDKNAVYKRFSIPRRNGKKRQIEVPTPALKYIQRIVHESLTKIYGPHDAVHGFVPGRSVMTNAKGHLGKRYVLNVDLVDFFPSITRKRVYGRLTSPPYSFQSNVANTIASLCTNAFSRLPQGSPSSPVIANMVAAQLDTDIADLCARMGCWYTRYADDITISTSRSKMNPNLARYPNARSTDQVVIGDALTDIIERNGFQINHGKSRLKSDWTRQMCAGLVVNDSCRPSPPRKYMRRLRSLVDHWVRNGWKDAAQVLHDGEYRPLFDDRQALVNHVIGRINYVRMVRGHDDKVAQKLADAVAKIPSNH